MKARLRYYFENNPLWQTLFSLKGNPKACTFTEPLWGIAFALYSPYLSVYMFQLGVTDFEIGIITTFGFVMQVFSALFGGLITDRIGRRLTTIIFDILSWTVPLLLFIFAQNFYFFLIGSFFNALYQVTNNSWTCLLVEDAEKDQLVNIFTWIVCLFCSYCGFRCGFLRCGNRSAHNFSICNSIDDQQVLATLSFHYGNGLG